MGTTVHFGALAITKLPLSRSKSNLTCARYCILFRFLGISSFSIPIISFTTSAMVSCWVFHAWGIFGKFLRAKRGAIAC